MRRHSFVLGCKHRPKNETYRYFFGNRIVRNMLSESIVSSSKLAGFKTRLKKFAI